MPRTRRALRASALLAALFLACGDRGPDEEPTESADDGWPDALFAEQAERAGIDFVHRNGMFGDFHMAELMGPGAALFDADGDGDLDAYLVQGRPLRPGATDGTTPSGRLFRNDTPPGGAPRFTDVTEGSGLPRGDYGMGVAAGDFDNDGFVDLYLTHFGPNRLLRNLGAEGRLAFEDVTAAAGVDDARWSVPATFFDLDGDGWLDLYVGNYLDYAYDPDAAPRCFHPSGLRDYCGPGRFPGVTDRLFRNRGRGEGGRVAFEDVTAAAGLLDVGEPGRALGAVATDLDGDGRVDLYVGNDAGPNHLWWNRGGGRFEDGARLAGVALNGDGRAEATMGIAAADPDRDGDLDLFLTHLVVETHTFYRNRGDGVFDDRSAASNLGPPSRVHTGFGTGFVDLDHDGWLDVVAVNGAVQTIADLATRGDPFPFHEPDQFFRHLGGAGEARFVEVPGALAGSAVSRGLALGDVDGDGDVDLLVADNHGPARLLVNLVGQDRRWTGLRLVTGDPPRDALGAVAALCLAGGEARWARVAVDGSYASASDPRIVWGLGDAGPIAGVRVRWADGPVEDFPAVAEGRYTTLRQGRGRPAEDVP